MTGPAQQPPDEVPSAAACAEAAAWIARLHGEGRTKGVEDGFRRWLNASAEHRAAFEMANDIWGGVERLPKPSAPAFVRRPRAGIILTLPRALVVIALFAAIAIGISLHWRDPGLATGVGEQRNLSLEDGTRVSLNTSSRIHVHYDRVARRVELDQGEAYFEVAKHADWPFIVTAGKRQVVALGTAFVVRSDVQRLTVTLVEGKVTVAPAGEPVPSVSVSSPHVKVTASGEPQRDPPEDGSTKDFTLSPGQRVTFVDHQSPRLDQPVLDRVMAWQHGQIILDHTPLADAVVEMNRYSDAQLKIEEPEAGRAEVTGIFRVGDSENFARAVAETYHLEVAYRGGEIVLSGLPQQPKLDVTRP